MNNDKCPKCRVEMQVEKIILESCERCDGCGWYEGGKTMQTTCEVCKGTGTVEVARTLIHGIDTISCLRNQLAAKEQRVAELEAGNQALEAAAKRAVDALDYIKPGEISSEDAHWFWNVRDDIADTIRGKCWIVKYTPEARQRILAQQEAAQAESDENNL